MEPDTSNKRYDTLGQLFTAQLEDLYDAEHRQTEVLPKMAASAGAPELRSVFEHHQNETKGQIARLEKAFGLLEAEPNRESCDATKGLIGGGEQFVDADGDPAVIDAGLIASAQRVEHYEMAGYGAARSLASQLGLEEVAGLLQQSLDEEGEADDRLTAVAQSFVNAAAAGA